MDKIYSILIIYFIGISVLTAFITAADKIFAKKNCRRVSEATLLTLGIMGGALSEYITMKIIRHKTLHKKFMIGLPAIIILQFIAVGSFLYFI